MIRPKIDMAMNAETLRVSPPQPMHGRPCDTHLVICRFQTMLSITNTMLGIQTICSLLLF